MEALCANDDAGDFIRQIIINCEMLSSVQLLCKSQVLACVPRDGSISYSDAADIVDVPEGLLRAVVRLTASVGFLCTPQPDQIAHSALSMQFVDDVGAWDALGFAADTLAPRALRMVELHRSAGPDNEDYDDDTMNCSSKDQDQGRRQRQALAYAARVMHLNDEVEQDEYAELLTALDWESLGEATVVDVHGESLRPAIRLASSYPALSIIFQTENAKALRSSIPKELASRLRVQARGHGDQQDTDDASVYVLHLSPSELLSSRPAPSLEALTRQLATHMHILRCNPLSRLVLLARTLPELRHPSSSCTTPASNGTDQLTPSATSSPQTLAAHRNLALFQLRGACEHTRADVFNHVSRTADADGHLVVTSEIRSPRESSLTVFEICYYRHPRS